MNILGVDFDKQGSITIDGRTFTGRNVTITGDQVFVDGVAQSGSLIGPVSVTVNGDAATVQTTSGRIEVKGACNRVRSTSGDIECGNIGGDVETVSGDVNCKHVQGSVRTVSGDIRGLK